MNVFGRTFDIVLAFICMFALPFMFFRAELNDIAYDKALAEADLFVERVQRSECIEEQPVNELLMNAGEITGIRFEIEIERKEGVVGTNETVDAKISGTELFKLLEKYGRLSLERNDTVKVIVVGSAFGIKTKTVRKGCVR